MNPISLGMIVNMSPQLIVRDLANSVQFYCKELDFKLDFQIKDFYAGVSKEGFTIHLKTGKPSSEERISRRRNEDLDIIFSVEGVEQLYKNLQGKSIEIIQPLRDQDYGKEFYILDPDGYIIAFLGKA